VSEGVAFPALAAFATAAILALLLTPIVRHLARRFEVMDHPGERRVNTAPVPRGGGIAVALAFVITSLGLLVAHSMVGICPPRTRRRRARSSRWSAGRRWPPSSAAWTTGSTFAPAGSWPGS